MTVKNCRSSWIKKQSYQHASCEVCDFQGTFYKKSKEVVRNWKTAVTSVSPKQANFISNAKTTCILKVPFTRTHSFLFYFLEVLVKSRVHDLIKGYLKSKLLKPEKLLCILNS